MFPLAVCLSALLACCHAMTLEVEVAKDVIIPCDVADDTGALKLWVLHSGDVLLPGQYPERYFANGTEGHLGIKDVEVSDAGYYTCVTETSDGALRHAPVLVVVKEKRYPYWRNHGANALRAVIASLITAAFFFIIYLVYKYRYRGNTSKSDNLSMEHNANIHDKGHVNVALEEDDTKM